MTGDSETKYDLFMAVLNDFRSKFMGLKYRQKFVYTQLLGSKSATAEYVTQLLLYKSNSLTSNELLDFSRSTLIKLHNLDLLVCFNYHI